MSTSEKDPFEHELGRAQRERMEAIGFYGAAWHTPVSPFGDAVARGDAEAVERLLSADPSLALSRTAEGTAVHDAAAGGHASVLRALLAHGAKSSALDQCGSNAVASALGADCATEAALVETMRTLLRTEGSRDTLGWGPPCELIEAQASANDNEEARTGRAAECVEAAMAVAWARHVRAARDYPRLASFLLRQLGNRVSSRACRAALDAAVRDGHWETARVLFAWLRLHMQDSERLPDPPAHDPSPAAPSYRPCPTCLVWWLSAFDRVCPACGSPLGDEDARPKSDWWPRSRREDAPPSCLEKQEAAVESALTDLTERSLRVLACRNTVSREVPAERWRATVVRLNAATVAINALRDAYQHHLWAVETTWWLNALELAAADWHRLTHAECERRMEWCNRKWVNWQSALRSWEGQHLEARDRQTRDRRGVGAGEPEAIGAARRAIHSAKMVREALIEYQAGIAAAQNGGRSGAGVLCPVEAYTLRTSMMRGLADGLGALERQRAALPLPTDK